VGGAVTDAAQRARRGPARESVLPLPTQRGLSRGQAAAYLGVSPGTFSLMVGDGRMPQPKVINTRLVWDRIALDRAFEALPDKGGRAGESDDEDERWRCAV
jgi:hypothetical protein